MVEAGPNVATTIRGAPRNWARAGRWSDRTRRSLPPHPIAAGGPTAALPAGVANVPLRRASAGSGLPATGPPAAVRLPVRPASMPGPVLAPQPGRENRPPVAPGSTLYLGSARPRALPVRGP